jgi:hypothetical protein
MFQQLQDFNNSKWYRSISKGSSNSKEWWCWNNAIRMMALEQCDNIGSDGVRTPSQQQGVMTSKQEQWCSSRVIAIKVATTKQSCGNKRWWCWNRVVLASF